MSDPDKKKAPTNVIVANAAAIEQLSLQMKARRDALTTNSNMTQARQSSGK